MGQRLIITVEALLRANCTLVQKIVHHEGSAPDDQQHVDPWDEELLNVIFPNGLSCLLDFCTHGDRLWVECDYNGYGTTKQTLAPVLAEYKIFHLVH